jgi:poly(3-hydroxybutyrate) depolymerase
MKRLHKNRTTSDSRTKGGLGQIAAAVCLALLCTGALAQAPAPALEAYQADRAQTSVSGLSSGAYMAVQLQVAYSKDIIGAGVIAGGPYYCAANNMAYASICMGQVPFFPPNPAIMAGFAKDFARARKIDPLSHLADDRVYVFSGTQDTIQRQPAVDATVSFLQQVGVKPQNLKYVNHLPAGHAVIAPGQGNDCAANESPYISHCETGDKGQERPYDQAGALLQHIYGPLNAPAGTPSGQIIAFDQRAYAASSTSMADTGYLYVPRSCTEAGAGCKVHVALHGCVQSAESVGNRFYTETGYNRWADSNRMLVLYPQVNQSALRPYNPKGCWDWWGYSGSQYAYKSAPQMKAIMQMVQRLTQPGQVTTPKPNAQPGRTQF